MTEQEVNALRANALHGSEQQNEADEIAKAIRVCKDAVKSASAMISARANMRQSHDGTWEVLN